MKRTDSQIPAHKHTFDHGKTTQKKRPELIPALD